ncbi:TetR/AcrR family transcriptional regulator [Streptomyces sp. QL37]|uniref:TetR/AcrR family transcriptional regulator n=1 Tax=Streptomyces sp. QL37 TaxID=2093747 RepID=UPI000CF2AE8C|nr:TetR/AcrR family transcriptional regulator [Streptomyces sp. QL37]PPQ56425.1 TetR family transcriptional regulator [Streptomyces sp. QL37]
MPYPNHALCSPGPEDPSEPRHGRLSFEREGNLFSTVLDLVRRSGYDGLTLDAVASAACCSKATLYRRYSGKRGLVAEALRRLDPLCPDSVDTGSLAGDLHALVEGRGEGQLRDDASLLRGLQRALYNDPELVTALRGSGPSQLDALIERAVVRGELTATGSASRYLPHLLLGAVLAWPLLDMAPVDRPSLHRYIDSVVLPALGIERPSAAT